LPLAFLILLQFNYDLEINNMQDMSLDKLYDFIQVAYSTIKLYTNNCYFPERILFTMIYLLQEENLNSN
jgi:hypothetical protein